jgi:predicted amidohydrolase
VSGKKVKIGTVQMSCTKEPKENLAKAIEKVREAAAERGSDNLFTRAFYIALFL